jgi:acyl-CoA thioester hydrolase
VSDIHGRVRAPALGIGYQAAMTTPFVEHYRARWADMDFNQHMRNAAFLGCAEETRMRWLDARGWPMTRFQEARIGPVILEDRLQYRRELRLLEPFRVDLLLVGITPDGARFRLRNRFFRDGDDALAAVVDSHLLWLDLQTRRPIVPPDDLRDLWAGLDRAEDFQPMARGG